ncbi:MAG: hypothetical protein WCO84_09830, partial [bacterium]
YSEAALTSLTASNPVMSSGKGPTVASTVVMRLTQNSANEFEYEYDLSSDASGFAFSTITLGVPVFTQYVFAAKGSDGERVKVEIIDANNNKTTVLILLTATYQNFTVNASALIKQIVFVQDRNIGSPLLNDLVKIQTKGLSYALPGALPTAMAELVAKEASYFKAGASLDPVTHFPYDNISGGGAGKYTQPTLIGFQLQILGDIVLGKINTGTGGMSKAEALAEIDVVMTNLLKLQGNGAGDWNLCWKGLLPWLNIPGGTPTASTDGDGHINIGLGDNANLSQSIAVMIGALESSGLGAGAIAKAEAFLSAQEVGYKAFVDGEFGIFRGSYDINDGQFSAYINRVANEFRGAVAFLAVRFPTSVPMSVWGDRFEIKTNSNYVARDGQAITNLAAWDGGAFQNFWPSLRNDESDFIGFRNALYNQLVTQLDYAFQNRIPGILSASLQPGGSYAGNIGIPQMSEANMDPTGTNILLGDIGSTYALAAAMHIDIYAVLGWMDSINKLSGLNNTYGLFDAARSA